MLTGGLQILDFFPSVSDFLGPVIAICSEEWSRVEPSRAAVCLSGKIILQPAGQKFSPVDKRLFNTRHSMNLMRAQKTPIHLHNGTHTRRENKRKTSVKVNDQWIYFAWINFTIMRKLSLSFWGFLMAIMSAQLAFLLSLLVLAPEVKSGEAYILIAIVYKNLKSGTLC